MNDDSSLNFLEPWAGHRYDEEWRYDMLTQKDERLIGVLDNVTGSRFDYSIHNTIRSGGSLDVDTPDKVDWNNIKVQPWYTYRNHHGEVVEIPLGVFIPSSPTVNHSDTGTTGSVELYDKLLVLDQYKFDHVFTVDAGQPYIGVVSNLLRTYIGETKMFLEASTLTLSTAMVWEAGTTMLRVINDLLDAANYFSLWVDGLGYFRAEPYVAPTQRNVMHTFTNDHNSIHVSEFSHTADGFDVPNKVVLVGSTEGEEVAPVAVAENRDPNSPWSYPSRNDRWIVHFESGVDAADEATLQLIADRRLNELSHVTSTYDIEHAIILLYLNYGVQIKHTDEHSSVDIRGVVQSFSISSDVGALMTTTIREVSS